MFHKIQVFVQYLYSTVATSCLLLHTHACTDGLNSKKTPASITGAVPRGTKQGVHADRCPDISLTCGVLLRTPVCNEIAAFVAESWVCAAFNHETRRLLACPRSTMRGQLFRR